jgi:hypothetical protein
MGSVGLAFLRSLTGVSLGYSVETELFVLSPALMSGNDALLSRSDCLRAAEVVRDISDIGLG